MQRVNNCLFLLSLSGADKPGPPEAPSISDVTKTGCVVAWQPPKEDGGSPVTGYHVERCIAKTDRWLKISKGAVTELKFTVTDLVEGTEYQFRISAENKVGVGPPSSPCPPFVAKDAFSKSSSHSHTHVLSQISEAHRFSLFLKLILIIILFSFISLDHAKCG